MRSVLKAAGPVLGVAFGGLTYWTHRLPVLRGSMWTLKDTLVRAGAVVTGVLLVLWILARLLPVLLNSLEGRTFESFVAARHVRSQKSGFLTVISVLSICGVAVSVVRAVVGRERPRRLQPRPPPEDPRQQRAHRRRHRVAGRLGGGGHRAREDARDAGGPRRHAGRERRGHDLEPLQPGRRDRARRRPGQHRQRHRSP